VRRNVEVADLSLWESGEAELSVVEADGSVSQHHFDDIRNARDLGNVLFRLASMGIATRSSQ
jgi:hypothetical protein